MRLSDIAARISVFAERRGVPQPPRPVIIAGEDDEEPSAADVLGHAEGQSFMIEYQSASGETSSRRITVFGIAEGANGVAVLRARCHERNATRAFRVDRILACIDYDGEVHDDVPIFMAETFGMQAAAFEETDRSAFLKSWDALRTLVRPQAILFAALSRSDGQMRPDEIGVAMDHCCQMAMRAELEPGEEELTALRGYINRQRPGPAAIEAAIEAMCNRPTGDVTRFLIAATHLVDVDGLRHPAEVALINDLSMAMTGVEVM